MKKIYFMVLVLLGGTAFANQANDFYNAGMAYYQQKKYDNAIAYFKAAVKLEPSQWLSYQYMGQSYYAQKNYNEAYDALNKSLAINSANPPVQQLVNQLMPYVIVPPMPNGKGKPVPGSNGKYQGEPMSPRSWLKLTSKLDYSMETDFNKAVEGWKTVAAQFGADKPKASAGNFGVGVKLEVGNALDTENAMLIAVSAMELDGFNAAADSASATITEKIFPLVTSLEMDFVRFFPAEDFRFYLKGGIGYYYAFVTYSQSVKGTFGPLDLRNEIGLVGNGDFGFNLGAGYEMKISKDTGVELSAAFRYAIISQMVTSAPNGSVIGLGVLPNGYMGVADTKSFGGPDGSRLAVIDLTGVEIGLGLVFYLF